MPRRGPDGAPLRQYPVVQAGGGGGAAAATAAAVWCMQCVEAARRGLCVRGAVVFPAAVLVTSACRVKRGMHNAFTH